MTTNLERWRYFYKDIESPDIYIDWTFYVTISAALQRRASWRTMPHSDGPAKHLFPNLYVIFIGPPGVGKSTAAEGSLDLFQSFGGFEDIGTHNKRIIKVAPHSLTIEQLYRYLNTHYTNFELPKEFVYQKNGKEVRTYLSCPLAFFLTEELASLFRENSNDLVNFLTEGYRCKDFHRETKTQGVDFIKNMCITLFGCATPAWIKEVSQNGLLKQGFAARTIFVWADEKRFLRTEYDFTPEQHREFNVIREHIRRLVQVYGPVLPTPEATKFLNEWYLNGGESTKGKDKTLVDYLSRKKVHVMKLAMVIHFSDKVTMTVDREDVEKALILLERTERDMHKALLSTSSENPAHRVAKLLEAAIEKRQNNGSPEWVSESLLLFDVYEECPEGRVTFDEAIKYLSDIGRIELAPQGSKGNYRMRKEQQR